jgi:hypothetical protein
LKWPRHSRSTKCVDPFSWCYPDRAFRVDCRLAVVNLRPTDGVNDTSRQAKDRRQRAFAVTTIAGNRCYPRNNHNSGRRILRVWGRRPFGGRPSTSRRRCPWRLTASHRDGASAPPLDTTSKAARTRNGVQQDAPFVLRSVARVSDHHGQGFPRGNKAWWPHRWSHPFTFAYVQGCSHLCGDAGRERQRYSTNDYPNS